MQFLRFLLFSITTLSLSACILEKDSSKDENPALEDKASIQPIKELEKEEDDDEPLASNSDYVPKHGHTAIDLITKAIYENGDFLAEDKYLNVKYFTHIPELPNQFGYQHTEVGPYLKTEYIKQYNRNTFERTSVQYSTLTTPNELLISHYLKSHIYSTIDFNQQTSTSSQESDGVMTQGEILTYTKKEPLFDEYTGNNVGISYSKSEITALNSESITIRSGTYDAAKAHFKTELKSTINDSTSNTWTDMIDGFIWLDINTGTVLKTTSTITTTNIDYPNTVYTTYAISEFISSDEFPKATINMSAAEHNTDESFKSLAMQEIIKNNQIMTENSSTRLSIASHFIKLPL